MLFIYQHLWLQLLYFMHFGLFQTAQSKFITISNIRRNTSLDSISIYYGLLLISHGFSYYNSPNNLYLMCDVTFGIIFTFVFIYQTKEMERNHLDQPLWGLLPAKIICFDVPTRIQLLTQQSFQWNLQDIDHLLTLLPISIILTIMVGYAIFGGIATILKIWSQKYSIRIIFIYYVPLPFLHTVTIFYNIDRTLYLGLAIILGLCFDILFLFEGESMENDYFQFDQILHFISKPRRMLLLAKILFFDLPTTIYFMTSYPFDWTIKDIVHLLTLFPACVLLIIIGVSCIYVAFIEFLENCSCSYQQSIRLMVLYYALLPISLLCSAYYNSRNIIYFVFALNLEIIFNLILQSERERIQQKQVVKELFTQPMNLLLFFKILLIDFPTRAYFLTQQPFEWAMQVIDHLLTLFVPSCILTIFSIYLFCKLIIDFCEIPSCKPQQLIKLVLVYYALLPISQICSIYYGCSNIVYLLCATIIGILFNLIFYSELDDMEREHFNSVQGLLVGKIILFDCATRGYFLTQQHFEISMQYVDHLLTLFVPCFLVTLLVIMTILVGIFYIATSLINFCKDCYYSAFNIPQVNDNQVVNVAIEQNLINFQIQYSQSKTQIKVQQYIRNSSPIIFIVEVYYLILVITHFNSYMHNNTYGIYLLSINIFRIFFMLLLSIHHRDLQTNDYQLSLITAKHYSVIIRQYSFEELDKYLEETITIFLFVMNQMLYIIFGIINILDCVCSVYLLVYGNCKSIHEILDIVLTLLPHQIILLGMTLFIIVIIIFGPAYILYKYCYTNRQNDNQVMIEMHNDQNNEDLGICHLCHIKLDHNDVISSLGCSPQHSYHLRCMRVWLQNNTTCPVCEAEV